MLFIIWRRWGNVTRWVEIKLAGCLINVAGWLPAMAVEILVNIAIVAGIFMVVTALLLTQIMSNTPAVCFCKIITTSHCNAKMILLWTYLITSRTATFVARTPVAVVGTPVVPWQQLPSPTSQGYSCYWLLLPTSSCSEDCRCKPGFPQLYIA